MEPSTDISGLTCKQPFLEMKAYEILTSFYPIMQGILWDMLLYVSDISLWQVEMNDCRIDIQPKGRRLNHLMRRDFEKTLFKAASVHRNTAAFDW